MLGRDLAIVSAGLRSRGLRRERVGKRQLHERQPIDANALRFAVNRVEQVEREIDVHPLDLTPRPTRLRQIQIGRQVAGGIIDGQVGQTVEPIGRDRGGFCAATSARRRTALSGAPRPPRTPAAPSQRLYRKCPGESALGLDPCATRRGTPDRVLTSQRSNRVREAVPPV